MKVIAFALVVVLMAGTAWGDVYQVGDAWVVEVLPQNGASASSGSGGYPLTDAIVDQMETKGSGGSSWVKGKVGCLRSTGQAIVKYGPLLLGAAARSTIAGVAMSIGASLIAGYIHDWLNEKGWQNDNGQVKKPGNAIGYTHSAAAQQVGYYSRAISGYGTATGVMVGPDAACDGTQGYWTNVGFVSGPSALNWSYSYWEGCVMPPSGPGNQNPNYKIRPRSGYSSWVEQVPGPYVQVDLSELTAALQASIEANSAAADKAVKAALALIAGYMNEAHKQFPNSYTTTPAGSPSMSSQNMQTIINTFNNAIPQALRDAVTSGTSPTMIGDDWEFTPEQLADANYEKLVEWSTKELEQYKLEQVTVPEFNAGGVEPPEMRDITEVLDATKQAAAESAAYAKLQSLKNTNFSQASCEVSVSLGAWGTVRLSICEWASILNTLGALMVMACGFGWTLWFFKGRGDA